LRCRHLAATITLIYHRPSRRARGLRKAGARRPCRPAATRRGRARERARIRALFGARLGGAIARILLSAVILEDSQSVKIDLSGARG
jgi:hypothetical protein